MTQQTQAHTVLIIDQDIVARVLLRNSLKQKNCQVLEAMNPSQARDFFLANQDQISFVFMEINLPIQEGFKTLKTFREQRPDFPIFIISSVSDQITLKKCMLLKIQGFFTKPLNLARVEASLFDKFPELKTAAPKAKAETAKRKREPKKEISMDQKILNARITREIDSVLALNRKLMQYLPRLNPKRLQEYTDEQKLISKSETYRSMRFALNKSNQDIVVGCVKNLPSQHRLAGALNFMEPRIFIPVIGEILSQNFEGCDPGTLHECVESALADLKMISNFEKMLFDHKLFIEREKKTAVFLHHPYKVDFRINQKKGDEIGYDFMVEKAELD